MPKIENREIAENVYFFPRKIVFKCEKIISIYGYK